MEIIAGFEKLTAKEKGDLLTAPVVVSLLAAISDNGEVDDYEQQEAERIARFQPSKQIPALSGYYEEVRRNFHADFERVKAEMPAEGREQKKAFLLARMENVKKVLLKLPYHHAHALQESYREFAKYVFKSHSSVLEHFLLPIVIDDIDKYREE
jgi:hypothetical protein